MAENPPRGGFYRYKPITTADGIRQIELLPADDRDALVVCRLLHATLSRVQDIQEDYIALSYVWGDASDTTTIRVDDLQLRVTKSLDCALRHIRDRRRVSYIWADGICINQKDDKEKEQQVQMMGRIYSLAKYTIIFLGPSDDGLCEKLLSVVIQEGDSARRDNPVLRQGFNKLMERSWFYRVWIFQELVLSKDPWIQIGETRCPWEELLLLLLGRTSPTDAPHLAKEKAEKALFPILDEPRGVRVLEKMHQARAAYHRAREDKLQGGLDVTSFDRLVGHLKSRRGFGVFDPRDMVFAHVGLVPGSGIQVDYSLTVSEIFTQFAYKWCQERKHSMLSILLSGDEIPPESRRKGLPSWAPDWTLVGHNPPQQIPTRHEHFPTEVFNCHHVRRHDARWVVIIERCPFFMEKSYMLFAVGKLHSRIQQVSNVITNEMLHESVMQFSGKETGDPVKKGPIPIFSSGFTGSTGTGPDPLSSKMAAPRYDWWRARDKSLTDVLPPKLPPSIQPFTTYNHQSASVLRLLTIHQNTLSLLCGRKIASINTGAATSEKIALVPSCTEPGDEICFMYSLGIGLVVRRQEFPDTISPRERRGPIDPDDHDIQDTLVCVKIIGKCLVDDMYRAFSEETKASELSVFAIV